MADRLSFSDFPVAVVDDGISELFCICPVRREIYTCPVAVDVSSCCLNAAVKPFVGLLCKEVGTNVMS